MSPVSSRFPGLVPTLGDVVRQRSGPRGLAIMGSTGSIGTSTLSVVRRYPEEFRVVALAAGSQAKLLGAQIREFRPTYAYLADPRARDELGDIGSTELIVGDESRIAGIVADSAVDVVVAAIVGSAGLRSTLQAIEAGKIVALANKESLVMAGRFVAAALMASQSGPARASLLPVDSEHASLFQLLEGHLENLSSITLTASGGPFLDTPVEQFCSITPAQAVRHPRWNMGAKISIDSATLMNKALEVIEAFWLFGVPGPQIRVLVHPQSIVHALVELTDGVQLAHLSVPDMQGPIAFAVRYPQARLAGVLKQLDLAEVGRLDFRHVDETKFRAVALAKRALASDDDSAAVLSVVNEVAVARFMAGELTFDRIVPLVETGLEAFAGRRTGSVDELIDFEKELRRWAADTKCR